MSSSLDGQLAYYCARANEYEEWVFRQGHYDRGVKPPPNGAPSFERWRVGQIF